ncbi:hypothetical protein ACOMCU_26870 [Lysinibacillus sp. UGB7]|uniref:hypothetical protein n=1 Tax=Lysinibacillus sp. UGB7 TaxID=3411039 RepID=UPI003B76158A
MNQAFVERLGYGVTPYAVIIWHKDDEAKHRTICNDEQDIQIMLERHQTNGDFYSQYDEPKVYYPVQERGLIA